ncbi:MAG: tetratricopeptide repeat protein [Alphaproteobacteria bacterium]|nr:tetratricopeptide repeat protein [Alphaproteobacteria bacterium]
MTETPDNPDANHDLGLSLLGAGRPESALPHFQTALEADPSQARFWLSYGEALLAAGRSRDALGLLEQGIGLGLSGPPCDDLIARARIDIDFQRALAHHQSNEWAEAEALYKRILKTAPDHLFSLVNIGLLYLVTSRPKEAAPCFRRVIDLQSDHAEAHYYLGKVRRSQELWSEAAACYREATRLKPDFVEAHQELASTLGRQELLDEAVASYRAVLRLAPDNAEAHFGLGVIFRETGRLADAYLAFRDVLAADPGHMGAWTHIRLVEVALNADRLRDNRAAALPLSEPGEVARATPHFALHRLHVDKVIGNDVPGGGVPGWREKATDLLPARETERVPVDNRKNAPPLEFQRSDNVIALLFFGRSGTGLLHSLIDGHPEVSTLPSMYLRGFFNEGIWKRLSADGWQRIPERFADLYQVLFDAHSGEPIPGHWNEDTSFIGQKEGMTCVGAKRDESLFVRKDKFCAEAIRLMKKCGSVDPYTFFVILHKAYEHAIGSKERKRAIFYHIHNPTDYAMANFLRYAPQSRFVMMIRDPVTSISSWCDRHRYNDESHVIPTRIVDALHYIDSAYLATQDAVGVRLEDLKLRPQETLRALCAWMGVKEAPSLYEMTAQGKKWWGDPSSPSYDRNKDMPPFGHDGSTRPKDSMFSESDRFVLQTVFYPFSVRFGYREPDPSWFRHSLKEVRLRLDDLMDFERVLAQNAKIDTDTYKKSFPYLYLRAGLFSRINFLDRNGEYKHMLRPLPIP